MSEFNLLDEKWIGVMDKTGQTEAVSLLELFRRAPELHGLANELPTLDIAILRLLLAILHASLARGLRGYQDGIALWQNLWEKGLPTEQICGYLEQYRGRFWLFDERYPFYQVAAMTAGTEYGIAKLLGTVSESNNKVRQFPMRTGLGKTQLTNAEAARWLLYVNAFDDTSAKPKTQGAPSSGAGWLGKLGLIYAEGATLEQTMLLNLVLLNEDGEPWADGKAPWELDVVRAGERTEIILPRSQIALLTLQSRRLLLKREKDCVQGYVLLGGDFFPKENAFSEQMTLWRKPEQNKDEYVPKRHNPTKQLWRDFAALTPISSRSSRQPGMLHWLAEVGYEEMIRLCTASVTYGDKDFFVDDVFSDSLTFSAAFLSNSNLGAEWRPHIEGVLQETEKAVEALGVLATDLAESVGDRRDPKGQPSKNMAGRRDMVKAETYFRLDEPFRKWLAGIDSKNDMQEEKCDQWRGIAAKILRDIGGELIAQSGTKAFVGIGKKNAPAAYNKFLGKLYIILAKEGVTGIEEGAS
ncbi:MAG: type I-E CRISPR-associated protein Cse1/CasA [Christensenellaceae bacterium]|jgi:CRISPR system Cascade subunit CasA|nr:type I-E CRISPR-associated protein Cse1/CasA [Christensenellaceae bacterium]